MDTSNLRKAAARSGCRTAGPGLQNTRIPCPRASRTWPGHSPELKTVRSLCGPLDGTVGGRILRRNYPVRDEGRLPMTRSARIDALQGHRLWTDPLGRAATRAGQLLLLLAAAAVAVYGLTRLKLVVIPL